MIIRLDHIAILTTSLEKTVGKLPVSFTPQAVEEQPKEGTREQYVRWPSDTGPSLLFMEPSHEGPYQRALEKRGPGLHHLGCVTDNLEDAVHYFAKQTLLLHPISLKTYNNRTVWMCRPGVPFLLELYQSSEIIMEGADRVSIDLPASSPGMATIGFIPGTEVRFSANKQIAISIGNLRLIVSP
jgi:hypothetical protein